MKKILLQAPNAVSGNNQIFGPDVNNTSQYWRELRERFYKLGYELLTADENPLDDCEFIIFLDSTSVDGIEDRVTSLKSFIKKVFKLEQPRTWPRRPLYAEAIKRGMYDKMALILWEGRVVSPNNYNKQVWDRFKYIFTWDDSLVDNKKFFKYVIPATVGSTLTKARLPFNQKKLLVNISANKYYGDPNELVSARRKDSYYFDKNYPGDFDLFGARWHRPVTRWQNYFPWLVYKFNSYRGVSPDKWETLSHYKFNICYENMGNVNGYITDKIFDSLKVGTVPIYWGAKNIDKYVDKEAFIDRRNFKNSKELAKYLFGLTEEKHNEMVSAGQNYLRSEKFKFFSQERFCDRIIEVLGFE